MKSLLSNLWAYNLMPVGSKEMVRSGIQKAVVVAAPEVPANNKKKRSGKSNWPARDKKAQKVSQPEGVEPKTKEIGVQTAREATWSYTLSGEYAGQWISTGRTLKDLERFFYEQGPP